jgi:hypothetical protein
MLGGVLVTLEEVEALADSEPAHSGNGSCVEWREVLHCARAKGARWMSGGLRGGIE